MNSSNRTAIVTGAAQGIGRLTAELLAENGYAVALADCSKETPEELTEDLIGLVRAYLK